MSATTLFIVVTLGVLVVAFIAAALALQWAGGKTAFDQWLVAATPYFLLWRVGLYGVVGTLYFKLWRPRLRAWHRRQPDGGEAGRQRLVRAERMLMVALVAIEATNVPDIIAWVSGG